MIDVEMVVDMQVRYLKGPRTRIEELTKRVCNRLEIAIKEGRPIILVENCRSNGSTHSDGMLAALITRTIAGYSHVWRLGKDNNGLLYSSGPLKNQALAVLERYRGDRIGLSGVNANFCVLDTGTSLHEAGFNVSVLPSYVANMWPDELNTCKVILGAYRERGAMYLIDRSRLVSSVDIFASQEQLWQMVLPGPDDQGLRSDGIEDSRNRAYQMEEALSGILRVS